jgi:hypothetical protein
MMINNEMKGKKMMNYESNMAKEIRDIASRSWGGNHFSSYTNTYVTYKKGSGSRMSTTQYKGSDFNQSKPQHTQ